MKTNVTLHPCKRFEMEVSGVEKRFQVSGVSVRASEGKGSYYEELYGCGGQRIELRGRRSEVRGQRSEERDSLVGAAFPARLA